MHPVRAAHSRQRTPARLAARPPVFRAFGAGIAGPVVAASSPWDGITDRIPHFWGWVVLIVLAGATVGAIWHGVQRFEQRTRYQRRMSLRWRLWLHRHPGPGFASLRLDLRRGYGLRGARKTAKRLYASMRRVRRLPGTAAAIRLGHMPHLPFRSVWAGPEEGVLYIAPPRSGKSGEIANQVLDAPGAVVVTSVRGDLVDLTAPLRAAAGPTWLFDPEDVAADSPLARVAWSLVHGCESPKVAMRRAAHMVAMGHGGGVSDQSFWENASARSLRALLHAAALGDYTMHDVYRWVMTSDPTPVRTLEAAEAAGHAAPGWAATLAQFIQLGSAAEATHASLQTTLGNTLDFMAHPAIARCVGGPARTGGFDVEALLRENGTLYMIADESDGKSLVAPVFSALVAEVHTRARDYGTRLPGRRIDPPLSMLLDEAPQICPVPLPAWSTTAAGSGIRLYAAIQGPAQMRDVWGEHGAKTIFNNLTTKVVWGGLADKEDREEISALAGEAEFWKEPVHMTTDRHGNTHRERHREWDTEAIIRPRDLRQLPHGYALVVTRTWKPTIVRTRGAWVRKSVKAALRRPLPAQRFTATQPGEETTPMRPVIPAQPPAQPGHTAQLSDDDLAQLLSGVDATGPHDSGAAGWGPPPNGPSTPPWGAQPRPWERGNQ